MAAELQKSAGNHAIHTADGWHNTWPHRFQAEPISSAAGLYRNAAASGEGAVFAIWQVASGAEVAAPATISLAGS